MEQRKASKIDANGDAEFNNGVFKGTLQAQYIKATGTVSSGTSYLLRSNNTLSIIDSCSGWISATYEAVAKEIRTLAKDSCLIRVRFPKVSSVPMTNRNVGIFRIDVNDIIVVSWRQYTVDTNIDFGNEPVRKFV